MSCFLRKKNLSPAVEEASDKEEMAIKKRPMRERRRLIGRRGDLFFTI